MSKSTWAVIANDPEFKKLSPEEQQATKLHYAETELANDPEFKALDPEEQKAAMSEFLADPTSIESVPPQPEGPKHYENGEVLPAALNNLVPSTARLLAGTVDAVAHPLDTYNALMGFAGGIGTNIADMIHPGSKQRYLQAHPEDKAGVDAATAYGERYNGWENIKRTIAEDPASVGADMSMLFGGVGAGGRLAGASNVAKVANVAAEVTNPINWALAVPKAIGNKTGATNALGTLGGSILDTFIVPKNLNPMRGPIKGAPGPTEAVQNALLLDATAGREQATINALNNVQEHVPGVRSTAADGIANDVVATKLQALAKDAEGIRSDEFTTREYENNAARLNDLDFGRTHDLTPDQILRAGNGPIDPAALSAEELNAALEAADAHNYPPVDSAHVRLDDGWRELLERPVMGDIIQRARKSAANARREFQIGEDVPAHQIPSSVLGPDGRPVMIDVPEQVAHIPGENLSFLHKAFTDAITETRAKSNGVDTAEIQDIRNARGAFLDWLEDNSRLPQHRVAREDSAAWRRLIDRRHAGEVFREALTGKLRGGDQVEGMGPAAQRAAAFANLLDSPANAVKGNSNVGKASTFAAYDHWSDLLTPDEMAKLERNKADLARMAQAEYQATKGKNFRGKLGNAAEAPQSPAMLKVSTTIANALSRWATGGVKDRVANNLAKAAEDPRELAALVKQAKDRKEQMDRVHARNKKVGQAVKRAAPVVNALRETPEQRRKRLEAENAEILLHL